MEKTAFNKKNAIFTKKLDLNARKKRTNWYVWSLGFHGAETW